MSAAVPGGPGHAETAAALAGWVTSRYPHTRPDGMSVGLSPEMAVQAAQVHALLAVAESVQFLAGMLHGAHEDLAEELRQSRGALVDELTEVRSDLVEALAESRGAVVDELTEVRSDLAVELDGIREVLDARQLGWRARRRLRRAARAGLVPVLPDGAVQLAADGGAR